MKQHITRRARALLAMLAVAFLLGACSGSGDPQQAAQAQAAPLPSSSGQVAPVASSGHVAPVASSGQVAPRVRNPVSYYAASRLAEQAAFGPTPALVADIQTRGIEGWVDAQLALPASQTDLQPFLITDVTFRDHQAFRASFMNLALTAQDQLRLRVTWALMQFIVVNENRGDRLGLLVWQNLMLAGALGSYEDLLYDVTRSATMGETYGLRFNRPANTNCPGCMPNTHYARALLQQFTIGPIALNADGTPRRDSQGRAIPAYTTRDVNELARALTGWQFDPEPRDGRIPRDWGNWRKPMVASDWPGDRDPERKQLLGRELPGFQGSERDLRDVAALLTAHDNAGPFMALRLIQSLVKSNPSPAYLQRVAAVFRDNGSGKRGDLKAVVKAVLLDAEARAGDDPAKARSDDGRIRDPFLLMLSQQRAMSCQRALTYADGWPVLPTRQYPFGAPTLAGYTSASDRAPASRVLSPEQRMLDPVDLPERVIRAAAWGEHNPSLGYAEPTGFRRAGCAIDELAALYARDPKAYLDWLDQRLTRGAMPPRLRAVLEQTLRERKWNLSLPVEGPMYLMAVLLVSPDFGVIR